MNRHVCIRCKNISLLKQLQGISYDTMSSISTMRVFKGQTQLTRSCNTSTLSTLCRNSGTRFNINGKQKWTSNSVWSVNGPMLAGQFRTDILPLIGVRQMSTGPDTILPAGQVDKHNGLTVDLSDLSEDYTDKQFNSLLTESLSKWRQEGRSCVWLKVPIHKSAFISTAANNGFLFHHAEHQMSLLKLWLNTSCEDRTPRFATHQIGVSGMVYREETKEILVVKDKNSQFSYWKFPGGLSDLEEDIADTAEREILEETGIKSEFLSILAFRQQHLQPGAFGRSDIFIVCRLKPLTFDIMHCENEISHCKWMSLEELHANTTDISPITHRTCQIMLHGIKHGFDNVDIRFKEMKSVYKGLKYKLYHRPLP
ncbi:nucleoside diphosphate-linked moiety X motif 6-like [Mytilus edulis]|uniref:nucleoside diphosphate-linked moiety X motif 6-like n=1 Tax=Mytilus edulis TaxID=6550 RepID=UPI0039EE2D83